MVKVDNAALVNQQRSRLPAAYAKLVGMLEALPAHHSVSADIGYDFIDVFSSIGQLLSSEFPHGPLPSGAFFEGGSGTEYCKTEILRSRLLQIIGYLKVTYAIDQARTADREQERKHSQKIFIVHGHAEALRKKVARFIQEIGFEPIVLGEQANAGRTVIEKFEAHSDVAYAIVLLTADDVGGEQSLLVGKLNPRARQNVILELGYFFGKHGRSNVCVLLESGVEMPSDIHGLVWETISDGDGWKIRLLKELRAARLLPVEVRSLIRT